MNGHDQYLIVVVILVPFLSALFVQLLPVEDYSSVRQIAALASGLVLVLIARHGFFIQNPATATFVIHEPLLLPGLGLTSFRLTETSAILLLPVFYVSVITFISDPKRVEALGPAFMSSTLFLVSLSATTILLESLLSKLVLGNISLWLLFYGISQQGAPKRGSAILQASLFFLVGDFLAIIGLFAFPMFQTDPILSQIFSLCIILPGFSRMFLVLVAPWMRKLFSNCSCESMILAVLLIVPVGASIAQASISILKKGPHWELCELSLIAIALGSMLVSSFLAILEKSARHYCLWCLVFFSSMAAFTFLRFEHEIADYLPTSLLASAATSTAFAMSNTRTHTAEEARNRTNSQALLWIIAVGLLLAIPGSGLGTIFWILFAGEVGHLARNFRNNEVLNLIILTVFALSLLSLAKTHRTQLERKLLGGLPAALIRRSFVSFATCFALSWLPLLWHFQLV